MSMNVANINECRVGDLAHQMQSVRITAMDTVSVISSVLTDHTSHWTNTRGQRQFMATPTPTSVVGDDVILRLRVMTESLDVRQTMTARKALSVLGKVPTENVMTSTNARTRGSKKIQKSFVARIQSVRI